MDMYIETERLILREILPTDETGFFELDSNPEVHTYLGGNPVQNIEQIRTAIKNIRQQYIENGIGRIAIIDKNTNVFIGWTGLKFVRETINNHIDFYDLGYRLIEKYWRKGIATETTKATIKYAFEILKLEEIFGMCDTRNVGSAKVLEKSGLQFIETFELNGMEHNWYTITKSGWLKKLNKKI